MTILLRLNPAKPDEKKIRIAAERIRNGGIVVFPTETVYGIGANALDESAARKIFRIKGRPSDNPMIVHVSSMEMADTVADIPKRYRNLIKKIWPAPLTIVVHAKKSLPRIVTGGLDTVAIRMPDSKVALSLIRDAGVPVVAPSANISGNPSSTSASHAKRYFNGKVDIIIDAGSSRFGLESTVIDLRRFEILRPGAFTTDDIKKSFGRMPKIGKSAKGISVSVARSPGTKYRHYSPNMHLFLFTGDISELAKITKGIDGFTFIGSDESCRIMKNSARHTLSLGKRSDLGEIASNLFDALIKLDDSNSRFAIIEEFAEKEIGIAIMNRIRKASANNTFNNKSGLKMVLSRFHIWY